MHISFVEILMNHIMEGTMIPKVQIERAIGPILSMYLADVLTETLRDDPDLSGPLAMICPEFPLKKTDNRQSTNLDWLMYNTLRRQLLFVELKTSDTSVNAEQNAIYHDKKGVVYNEGGSFLIDDLELLKDSSKEYGKYFYILGKVSQFKREISECHDAKIIYLVPKSAAHKVQVHADKVLTFGMLSNSITGSFAKEWTIIRRHLCSLDNSSQSVRNRQSVYVSKKEQAVNYTYRTDFRSIVMLCKKRGDDIIVGFMGGEKALASRDITSLEGRKYKWDHASGGTGIKDSRNWIPGSVFSRIIKEKNQTLTL